MKKKILLSLLLSIPLSVTHSIFASVESSVSSNELNGQVDHQDQALDDLEKYLPPIENYVVFTSDFLKLDYLLGKDLPVKKFDFANLFRFKNIGFLYAIRIKQSRFACCLGVGASNLGYVFNPRDKNKSDNNIYSSLKIKSKFTKYEAITAKYLGLDDTDEVKVTKSCLTIPYIDFLLRFRFNSVLDDPKRGFYCWVGGKCGFRLHHATTQIMYDCGANGERGISLVRTGTYNIKPVSWWLQGSIGFSRFGIVAGYSLSPLFQKNKVDTPFDSANPFSIGISLDL